MHLTWQVTLYNFLEFKEIIWRLLLLPLIVCNTLILATPYLQFNLNQIHKKCRMIRIDNQGIMKGGLVRRAWTFYLILVAQWMRVFSALFAYFSNKLTDIQEKFDW